MNLKEVVYLVIRRSGSHLDRLSLWFSWPPNTRDRMLAVFAITIFNVVLANGEALPVDDHSTTIRTESVVPFVSGDISDVGIMNALLKRDLASFFQGFNWSGWQVSQLVLGVKAAEMERDVRTQVVSNPVGKNS